jgi:hypothetical protein
MELFRARRSILWTTNRPGCVAFALKNSLSYESSWILTAGTSFTCLNASAGSAFGWIRPKASRVTPNELHSRQTAFGGLFVGLFSPC